MVSAEQLCGPENGLGKNKSNRQHGSWAAGWYAQRARPNQEVITHVSCLGLFMTLVTNPIFVIKTRMQTALPKYRGVLGA